MEVGGCMTVSTEYRVQEYKRAQEHRVGRVDDGILILADGLREAARGKRQP